MKTYLPGNIFAISAHLFPTVIWASRIILSSSSLQASLQISGLRWLCQRSRHCLPIRPGSWLAISDHFLAPYFSTSSSTFRSSSAVHGPLTSVGFNTFCHLCRHCTSVLSGSRCEINFQFFAPCSSTAALSILSFSELVGQEKKSQFKMSTFYWKTWSKIVSLQENITSSAVHFTPEDFFI